MTENTQTAILRRMTRRDEGVVVENPLTTSRAVRLALTKAANDTVGLVLTVSSVAEYINPLDEMLAGLPDGLMLVGLQRDVELRGMIAFDLELRAAVLEMETMGVLSAQTAEQRTPTRADLALCGPLIAAFLGAFPDAVQGTDLAGWADDVTHHNRISDTRAAGLALDDCAYRVVQMEVQLGSTDRRGTVLVALPLVLVADAPQSELDVAVEKPDWHTHFPDLVAEAPARLDALLHRFDVPLSMAQGLKVGSVLPLPGCLVSSVKLLAPDGHIVAQAKLGQSGGMRAVRIEAAPLTDMGDLGVLPSSDMPGPITKDVAALPIDAVDGEAAGFDPPPIVSEETPEPDMPMMMDSDPLAFEIEADVLPQV
jgi:flagellar motor switch protein FliM